MPSSMSLSAVQSISRCCNSHQSRTKRPASSRFAGHRHDARAWGELFRSWVVARARMPTDTVATLLDGDIAGVARARAERALTLTLNVDRSQRIDRIVD